MGFRMIAEQHGWKLSKKYAVGMIFLNQDETLAQAARDVLNEELEKETLTVVGWREVPVNHDVLGELALTGVPQIEQVFVNAPAGWRKRDLERRLFMVRRRVEKRLETDPDFTLPVYQG